MKYESRGSEFGYWKKQILELKRLLPIVFWYMKNYRLVLQAAISFNTINVTESFKNQCYFRHSANEQKYIISINMQYKTVSSKCIS
jgi:Leu/Phe-tRNA-protein transferase